MGDTEMLAAIEEARRAIGAQVRQRPAIGLVLGSGLGSLADEIQERVVVPYDTIPNWPRSTVPGHHGQLVLGTLEGQPVIAQQGRAHFYEGYAMQQVTFPIRVMVALGIDTLILTNAAGGLDPAYRVGDVMCIEDHINFPGMAGHNPLTGPNEESLGPRFVGMSQAYDRRLRALATEVAGRHGLQLRHGVYVGLAGPNFETPAEIRMLRILGAHAVGMSTVHEVLVARHAGVRVLAFSGITNVAIDTVDTDQDADHEEVLEAGKIIVPRLAGLVRGILRALD
jgi:purine-nucleoside phosphorylase